MIFINKLVNAIMTEEFEKTGDDQATKILIDSIVAEESEQNGEDSATLALVQALQKEDTKQSDLESTKPFSLKVEDKSFPPLKQ